MEFFIAIEPEVSVPFRGFRGLQGLNEGIDADDEYTVSVPFRGFRGLQDLSGIVTGTVLSLFQSPSGVLGVCRSGAPNPPGWCGCPTLPGLLIPRAF